jgi:hypothetical protein
MKLIRYRKPSMKSMLGVTRAKRKVKRSLGISQAQAWTKPSRIKQKIKYEAGLYSPEMKVIRQTSNGRFPNLLGLFNSKKK